MSRLALIRLGLWLPFALVVLFRVQMDPTALACLGFVPIVFEWFNYGREKGSAEVLGAFAALAAVIGIFFFFGYLSYLAPK